MTEKLFVYGIFLDEYNRDAYGMSNPKYTTVPGFITIGAGIVQAMPVSDQNIALTGLVVDMDSTKWRPLDSLEGGYDRVKVRTNSGDDAWMYVMPERRYSSVKKTVHEEVDKPTAVAKTSTT